uniref:hypothetical protein n=1 Tax=Agathobacter sp. TaxID=2021311 RepID=UPI00405619CE
MNSGYFRINLPKEEAIERLCEWNECGIKERIETAYENAVGVSLDDSSSWKGLCLYAYENDGWTVFEDLSGGFATIPADSWMLFAQKDDLVVAGYNDVIMYAELIVITQGVVQKEFLEDVNFPEDNINSGECYLEIQSWVDVAGFVDEDEYVYSDEGTVLIL